MENVEKESWWLCNDSKVKEVEEPELDSDTAYLLFYIKSDEAKPLFYNSKQKRIKRDKGVYVNPLQRMRAATLIRPMRGGKNFWINWAIFSRNS